MDRTRTTHPFLAIAAAFVGLTSMPLQTAAAQSTVPATALPAPQRPRFIVAGDLVLAAPRRDLARYISNGYGVNVTGFLRMEQEGILHLRADVGSVRYGSEQERVSVRSIYGRENFDLETSNNIDWFGVGPQLMIPGGPIRPYVNASVGLTRFRTTSVLRDAVTREEYGRADNASDFTTGWVLGGGIYVPFGRRSPLALNLGARYHQGGEATYLNEGGIQDNPDGSVTLTPHRSRTDFVLWQLGVSLRLPQPGGTAAAGL